MTSADAVAPESHTFEADVAKLLHLMVHSVYSDRDVFLRELISNAADACEKLRFEAIANPTLLGDDPKPRITLLIDGANRRLTVADNGIGMSRDEMVEALGTIARSGTQAFMDRVEAGQGEEGAQLIGQFGVGFYSAFMVADRVEVISRRAGNEEAALWSSDGKGSYRIVPVEAAEAPARGTRVILHLKEDAASYTERYALERTVKEQSGHVPVPIAIVEKPGAEPQEVADGAALWVKPRAEITAEAYTDFYRSLAGQFDEPALTVHFRAEGRHEYTALAFVPGSKPFDLFDPDRWRDEVFDTDRTLAHRLVTTLVSDEEDGADALWVHTRGLRVFGRPDLSVHGVRPDQLATANQLVGALVGQSARGLVIDDGMVMDVGGEVGTLTFTRRGHLDDPDYNNEHLEITWT